MYREGRTAKVRLSIDHCGTTRITATYDIIPTTRIRRFLVVSNSFSSAPYLEFCYAVHSYTLDAESICSLHHNHTHTHTQPSALPRDPHQPLRSSINALPDSGFMVILSPPIKKRCSAFMPRLIWDARFLTSNHAYPSQDDCFISSNRKFRAVLKRWGTYRLPIFFFLL